MHAILNRWDGMRLPMAAMVFCALLSGCGMHVKVPALPPAPGIPPQMVTVPPPSHVTEEMPPPEPEPETQPAPEPKPEKPPVRKPAPKPEPAPVAPAPAVSLGTLSTDGNVSAAERNGTMNLLNNVRGRANGIPMNVQNTHMDSMQRVRTFLQQAQDAWNSGDVEGAKTLATKANVLLNDLQK